ncbi:MAG: hypothetical protein ABW167_17260 [Baekduia sp.]
MATLAVIAVIGLTSAGCGSNAPSKTGTAGAASTSGNSSRGGTVREKAVRFAQCMRKNGVKEFPDPDASGELTIDGIVNGSSLDPDAPAWKAAIGTCRALQPSGFTGHKRDTTEQESALAFAQCVRDNGVKDFPDPAIGDPLVDTRRIPSTDRAGGMSVLNAAMRKCGAIFSSKLGLKGR